MIFYDKTVVDFYFYFKIWWTNILALWMVKVDYNTIAAEKKLSMKQLLIEKRKHIIKN